MTEWKQIEGTNWEYDIDAYENLPASRKEFWDRQVGIQMLSGIRTNADGSRVYMRVRMKNQTESISTENEINLCHFDRFKHES